MSDVTANQPHGTPTWIDLGVPDLEQAMDFYGALFGWEFDVGPAERGHYTMCLLRGRRVAAMAPNPDTATSCWWNVHFAVDDCDEAAKRIAEEGGAVLAEPVDVMDQGRMAIVRDPVGAHFGLWQGREHIGSEVVGEPGAVLRHDLNTPMPGPAREFYPAVFDLVLDRDEDQPELDLTPLRRPDGHEVAGVLATPGAPRSVWTTTFEVADADEAVRLVTEAGGDSDGAHTTVRGRTAVVTDPFGARFALTARAR